MKESRQWKDGVELFLDNRQIFLLFFASAVVLSLVFALGVVVGKRAGDPPPSQPATDPLALLDQMGGQDKLDENLTFHEALGKEDKAKQGAGADAAGLATAEGSQAPAVEPEPAGEPQPEKKAVPEPKAAKKKVLAHKLPDKVQVVRQPGRGAVPAAGGQSVAKAGKAAKAARADKDPQAKTAEEAGNYSLQLSSFQDKGEAQVYMRKLRDGGMTPFLVAAQIPGRGIWYRVRIGTYKNWEEALEAKQTFERDRKIIAYVAKN
jgi:DedD protein